MMSTRTSYILTAIVSFLAVSSIRLSTTQEIGTRALSDESLAVVRGANLNQGTQNLTLACASNTFQGTGTATSCSGLSNGTNCGECKGGQGNPQTSTNYANNTKIKKMLAFAACNTLVKWTGLCQNGLCEDDNTDTFCNDAVLYIYQLEP